MYFCKYFFLCKYSSHCTMEVYCISVIYFPAEIIVNICDHALPMQRFSATWMCQEVIRNSFSTVCFCRNLWASSDVCPGKTGPSFRCSRTLWTADVVVHLCVTAEKRIVLPLQENNSTWLKRKLKGKNGAQTRFVVTDFSHSRRRATFWSRRVWAALVSS